MQTGLFDPPPKPKPKSGFVPRDYQAEDADAVCAHWEAGRLHVLCVWATGLGKSVLAAMLAARAPEGKRTLIVVDSTDLAGDLYNTCRKFGLKPGILTGDYKSEWGEKNVLVATKQCLCAGERYRTINPLDFDRVIVDECESALANQYVAMMVYFIDANPDLKVVGMTATPLPASNRSINDLFATAATEPGPLYRDLQWAYLNGWLVKPMQGILRCSMDFSSLKVRKQEGGEKDYSDKDIAKLMLEQDEREWLELAGGVYQISKGHTAIVVCPNSTEVADKLAGYIEGAARAEGRQGYAVAIHRKFRDSGDRMKRFKAGEFPIAVSVRMFEKGFDYDKVNMVVMVRRTKSLRLYTQVAGRGTRPLVGIRKALGDETDAQERMKLIAESDKPSCVIVDCVGINDKAKDILGVIDILGRGVREDIRERVRQMMLDRANDPDSDPRAETSEKKKGPGIDVGDEARKAVKDIRDEFERERRARLSAKVETQFEIEDRRKTRPKSRQLSMPKVGNASGGQVKLLIAMGVKPDTAIGYDRKQASAVLRSYEKEMRLPDWKRLDRMTFETKEAVEVYQRRIEEYEAKKKQTA